MTGVLIFACFYYPVVGIQSSIRQGLVLLFVIQLFIYASSFAQMTIAPMPDAHTAASIVTLLTLMSIIFSGVLQTADALPGFWIFMVRYLTRNHLILIIASYTDLRYSTAPAHSLIGFPALFQPCFTAVR